MLGLTNITGRSSPTGMLFKSLVDGQPVFSWLTDNGARLGPTKVLSEITSRHIAAAEYPVDEDAWLDRSGWERVLQEHTVYGTP